MSVDLTKVDSIFVDYMNYENCELLQQTLSEKTLVKPQKSMSVYSSFRASETRENYPIMFVQHQFVTTWRKKGCGACR